MNRLSMLLVFIAGCSASDQGTLDGGDMQSPIDQAQPIDLVTGGSCPCVKGNYCDVTTNTCKLGCAADTDCNGGQRCDTPNHQCYTPCGAQMCHGNELCCPNGGAPTCSLLCPTDMSVVTGTCSGPSDCTGASPPICCVHFTLGMLPTCPKSATLQCESTCNTVLPQTTCNSMGAAAACKQKTDCTDSNNANCCALPQFVTVGNICVSDLDAAGASCVN